MMEKDVKQKIELDFQHNAVEAVRLIEQFEQEFKLGARVSRCVVVLSEGKIGKLKEAIESAKTDWRDVIQWAETVDFEFRKPFTF